MNDTKVVRYECTRCGDKFMNEADDATYVTHADYRALEERYAETVEGAAQLGLQVVELTKELASLRGKVGEFVVSSTAARRELQSCQSVIHLHGGFDPAYVEGAQKAMRDLSAALEGFA